MKSPKLDLGASCCSARAVLSALAALPAAWDERTGASGFPERACATCSGKTAVITVEQMEMATANWMVALLMVVFIFLAMAHPSS